MKLLARREGFVHLIKASELGSYSDGDDVGGFRSVEKVLGRKESGLSPFD